MNEIMQFLEVTFTPLVFIFTVASLFVMGLQAKMPQVIAASKNKKTIAQIFVWGWVLGPALAYLITLVLPLAESYVIGLLLFCMAPVAPFLPLLVERARGDMNFAGALVPLVAVGTVVFMPLMGPLLVKGVSISIWMLGKPLLLTILLPLVIGAAVRHYAETVATRIIPAITMIAKLTTFGVIVWAAVIYGREMLATAGSFALLSMTVFMVVMGLITYRFGFGLKQNQRSVMSLGMLTRNGSVVLISALSIPNVEPGVITYVIMFVLGTGVFGLIAAILLSKFAGKTDAGATT
jgi:BASS family bile acid:Na+ symporter